MTLKHRCPFCGGKMKADQTSRVHGGRGRKKIVICENWPQCDVYIGCHDRTGEPLGTPADKNLRQLRQKVHAIFDPSWKMEKDKRKARMKSYKHFARLMEMSEGECHIGMFDTDTCLKAIGLLTRWRLVG